MHVKTGGRTGFQQSAPTELELGKNTHEKNSSDTTTKKTYNTNKTNINIVEEENKLSVFTTNANGLKKKVESFKSNISNLNIGIFTIQETNFSKRGEIKIDNFKIFEAIRTKAGGGTILGAHISLQPILIQEYSDSFELLVIEVTVGEKVIRVLTGYGPQETWTADRKMQFFMTLEEEISKAELSGRSILLCLDANSKMGQNHIPEDPHDISENGKVLEGILSRHALTVANGISGKYSGVITRERITKDHIERSAIDLVCLSDDLVECLENVRIDEDKNHCLESIQRTNRGIKISKSDHNSIVSKFRMKWTKKLKTPKLEMYNLKNKEAQIKFKNMTSKQGILSNIIDPEKDVTKVTKKFLKRLNGCVRQCFQKVRITEHNGNSDIVKLFDKRRVLRSRNYKDSKKLLIEVEEKLADLCAEDNKN